MTTSGLYYRKRVAEILWGSPKRETAPEEPAASVTIESTSLHINRETKNIELCVTGMLERRDGTVIKDQYKISIAMWEYSGAVPKGIEQETYEEVMETERDALFADYLDVYVHLSDKEPIKITRKEYLQREGEGMIIEYHPLLQKLINHQATVYAKMRA